MYYDFEVHPDFLEIVTEIDNVITILEEIDPELDSPRLNLKEDEDDEYEHESEDKSGMIVEQVATALEKLEEVQQKLFELSEKKLSEKKLSP